jgi:hypothetical protein
MTARYAHLSPDYLQSAVEQIAAPADRQAATGIRLPTISG